MIRILISFLLWLFLASAFAAKIESLNVNVSGGKGNYTANVSAILVGDYQRYVSRQLDVNNYASMGVPYIIESKSLPSAYFWVHMKALFTDVQYYTKASLQQSPTQTKINFSLANKKGPYPDQHVYKSLNGFTIIKVISGSGNNTKFSVISSTHFVLKPGTSDVGVRGVISHLSRGLVQAFAK